MKGSLKEVKVDQEIFKRIKKYKNVIYVDDKEELSDIEVKDKVIVENALTLKKIKRKVINVYEAKNKEELITLLGKKEKYIYPQSIKTVAKKDDVLVAIEFKSKKKIIRKIISILLIFLVIFLIVNFLFMMIDDIKTDALRKDLEDIREEITYVIVEINPKIVFELVNGKIKDKACLNIDCKNLYDDIDIQNKTLKDIVEELYSKALEEKLDLSNGVIVLSVDKKIEDNISSLPYVKYQNINYTEERNYIKDVLDNDSIKKFDKVNKINEDKLNIYMKHKYYDKYFKCSSSLNSLECYLTDDLIEKISLETDTIEEFFRQIEYVRILEFIMDLFSIKYKSVSVEGVNINLINGIYLNDKYYDFFNGTSYAVSSVSTDPSESSGTKVVRYNEFSIKLKEDTDSFYYELVPVSKFNLVNSSYNESDINILSRDDIGDILLNDVPLPWEDE